MVAPAREMQIDLMVPLVVDSMVQDGQAVSFRRDGNAFFARPTAPQAVGARKTITVYYHGKPQPARRPPWDGGFTWTSDSLGRPWVVTTDQGLGASVWWPNKDIGADEPDSQRIALTVPDPMIDVSNGRLRSVTPERRRHDHLGVVRRRARSTTTRSPSAPGSYAHYTDFFEGERGMLTLDFWPLSYHVEAAQRQFPQAKTMLACFEHWFGPYPWYEDGYKLVETPHPGMEHQSAVAYGNWYQNGYRAARRLRHRHRHEVGLHHRARERARVVRQQHHGEGQRRHVGARELRQLRGEPLHRVPVREGGGRASTSSARGGTSGTTGRSSAPTA